MAKRVLTQFSSHANTIADTFRAAFVKAKVGKCTVEMTAPEESTQGGLLGLQHATLRTPDGRAIVVGTIHAGEKKAEFRAWAPVSRMYEDRFKTSPPFNDVDYAVFLAKAEPILAAFALDVTVTETMVEPPKAPQQQEEHDGDSLPPGAKKKRLVTWILFAVALIAIIGGGMYTWKHYIKR